MRFVGAAVMFMTVMATANATYAQCRRIENRIQVCPPPEDCYYAGSAPFCDGKCHGADVRSCGRSPAGCGAGCWTGWKRLCCRHGRCPSETVYDVVTGNLLPKLDAPLREFECFLRNRDRNFFGHWRRRSVAEAETEAEMEMEADRDGFGYNG